MNRQPENHGSYRNEEKLNKNANFENIKSSIT